MIDELTTLFLLLLAMLVGAAIGSSVGKNYIRNEAIKAGAAHYEHKSDTPNGVFTWGPESK